MINLNMMKLQDIVKQKINLVVILIVALQIFGGCAKSTSPGKGNADNPQQYILLNGVEPTEEAFAEIKSVFGEAGHRKKAIGVGFIISYLQYSPEVAAEKLKTFLALSEQFNIPIIVQIDGEQWWGNRPDLWNWWDAEKSGFDPSNKRNVEWTDWSPDAAVKIGWRNWGRQLRVLPMPNLMSPDYREACKVEMRKLVPIVMDWWNSLSLEKKHLLVGVKVGWESAIGVNNWYYPNGNDLLKKPEADDPQYGLKVDSLPDRGVQEMGYAAVSTMGVANSGELKEEQLTQVVQFHLEDLSKLCADLGVPRDRLFTHAGGWSKGETLYTSAINRYSCPGWSFYTHASDPRNDVTAMGAVKASDAPFWGAVEWLYDGKTKEEWTAAIENTLAIQRVKYMCIYNWGGIRDNDAAISAIRAVSESK
jgi:hypothetical protein